MGKERLMALGNLAHRQTLGLIEHWWESEDPGSPVTEAWGRLASDSRLTWAVAEAWLQEGRHLSLIAIDALLLVSAPLATTRLPAQQILACTTRMYSTRC